MLDIKRKWWIFITLVCFKCRLHIVLGLIQISTDLPKFSLWTIFFPFLPSHHTIRSVNYEVTNVTKQYWIYIPFQLTQSIKFTWFRRHFFVIFFHVFVFLWRIGSIQYVESDWQFYLIFCVLGAFTMQHNGFQLQSESLT